MMEFNDANSDIWEKIYAGGSGMAYPDDMFVRLLYRLIKPSKGMSVLDYGFGSGATTEHLARINCQVSGVEISQAAIDMVKQRLARLDLSADFALIKDNSLPYADNSFDFIIAWQVLTYNTNDSFQKIVAEFKRVMKPKAKFLAAFSAPGDYIDEHSTVVAGDNEKEISSGSQLGARVIIPTEPDIRDHLFAGCDLKLGGFSSDLNGLEIGINKTNYWLVYFEK